MLVYRLDNSDIINRDKLKIVICSDNNSK